MPAKVVITGCGGAGAQYVCNILNLLGLRSGYQQVYSHDLLLGNYNKVEARWKEWDVDVSWLAAPFISEMPKNVLVWHQVRDPLKVVRCWYERRILDNPSPLITGALPGCLEGEPLDRAIRYVLGWNRLTETQCYRREHYHRYRIEKLNCRNLYGFLRFAGWDIPEDNIKDAIRDVSKIIGTCQHLPNAGLTWDVVNTQPSGPALQEMAKRYGYDHSFYLPQIWTVGL